MGAQLRDATRTDSEFIRDNSFQNPFMLSPSSISVILLIRIVVRIWEISGTTLTSSSRLKIPSPRNSSLNHVNSVSAQRVHKHIKVGNSPQRQYLRRSNPVTNELGVSQRRPKQTHPQTSENKFHITRNTLTSVLSAVYLARSC